MTVVIEAAFEGGATRPPMTGRGTIDLDALKRDFRAKAKARGIDPVEGATGYQASHIQAELRRVYAPPPALDEDGIPAWAQAARRRNGLPRSSDLSRMVRAGDLGEHRVFPCERDAVANLEHQADAWQEACGRLYLTHDEARVLHWENYYLTHFQNTAVANPTPTRRAKHVRDTEQVTVALQFKRDYAHWIASLRSPQGGREVELDLLHAVSFVAYKLAMTEERVKLLLASGGAVVELRAALGLHDLFAVQVVAIEPNTGAMSEVA